MASDKHNEQEFYAATTMLTEGSLGTYSPKIFSMHGRVGRLRFIGYLMLAAFLVVAAYLFIAVLGNAVIAPDAPEENNALLMALGMGLIAALLGPYFVYAKRRLNDMNRDGRWLFLIFVPVANVLFHFYLMFAKGDGGSNDYGPSAIENPRFMWIVGVLPVVVTGLVFGAAVIFLLGLEKYGQQMNAIMQFHQ